MNAQAVPHQLATRVRERWARQMAGALEDLDAPMREFLARPAPAGVEAMAWMEATMDWQAKGGEWLRLARQRLLPGKDTPERVTGAQPLSLVDDEAIDDQIAAGRMAVVLQDAAQGEFNDLRLRLQHLERRSELRKSDRVQAHRLCEELMQAWLDSGQTRPAWQACQPLLRRFVADAYTAACHQANAYLLEHGVLPEIDLRAMIRRPSPGAQRAITATAPNATGATGVTSAAASPGASASTGASGPAAFMRWSQAAEEVGGKLRRLLADKVPAAARWLAGSAQGASATAGAGAAPSLTPEMAYALTQAMSALTELGEWSSIEAGVAALKRQTRALKSAAGSDRDKAVIELVALIFDSILAEERIPSGVRVWFARLQMPVLRVAMVDPDFLGAIDHPARVLIDRMGSCVMGFDARVSIAPLEAEIKRVVQVIEQYPETGRRVFELVLQEFQTFLSRHLLDRGGVERVVSVAQQVEQKETLTVRFTIELRRLLGDAPVREPVRDFLFKVWVEVMAVASVRFGPQHAESQSLRQAAADVLWMASAKPSREERAQVIARLPALLARLREGMGLLGLGPEDQEAHVQRLSDALAEAFMSRGDPLSQDWLAEMTRHFARLEEFLDDETPDALALDQESIEWITGVDASNITVLPDAQHAPSPALQAWATDLPLGAWFELDHNARIAMVQLVWRSQRQQLFLFVGPDQDCYLLQVGRVAAYLEAGLLKSCEAEALTVRATRDALHKLDANPERLLA